jgi:hypothetical protein
MPRTFDDPTAMDADSRKVLTYLDRAMGGRIDIAVNTHTLAVENEDGDVVEIPATALARIAAGDYEISEVESDVYETDWIIAYGANRIQNAPDATVITGGDSDPYESFMYAEAGTEAAEQIKGHYAWHELGADEHTAWDDKAIEQIAQFEE